MCHVEYGSLVWGWKDGPKIPIFWVIGAFQRDSLFCRKSRGPKNNYHDWQFTIRDNLISFWWASLFPKGLQFVLQKNAFQKCDPKVWHPLEIPFCTWHLGGLYLASQWEINDSQTEQCQSTPCGACPPASPGCCKTWSCGRSSAVCAGSWGGERGWPSRSMCWAPHTQAGPSAGTWGCWWPPRNPPRSRKPVCWRAPSNTCNEGRRL